MSAARPAFPLVADRDGRDRQHRREARRHRRRHQRSGQLRADAVGRPEHRRRAVFGRLPGVRSEGLSVQRCRSRRHGAAGRRERHARGRRPPAGAGHFPRRPPGHCRFGARRSSRRTLDGYGTGLSVNAISIEDAAPPREVADAFDEVQRAEQDEDRFVEESNQYSNQKLGAGARPGGAGPRRSGGLQEPRGAGSRRRGEALPLGLRRIRQGARRDPQAAVHRDHGKGAAGFQQGHRRARHRAGRRALPAAAGSSKSASSAEVAK